MSFRRIFGYNKNSNRSRYASSTNYIRNVMTKAKGENKAQSVLGRITPTESDKPIEILDWMDARSVAELISDEHPQLWH